MPGLISGVRMMRPPLRRAWCRREDVGERFGVADPLGGIGREPRPARLRELVVPRPLIALGDAPFGGDEPAFFEPMHGLIEGAVAHVERAARARFDPLRDL